MNAYLWCSGVALNVVALAFIALAVWVWFIFPAVEAASMTRWYRKMGKVHGVNVGGRLKLFISCYEPFGRDFTSTKCRYGWWHGVGDWKVYDHDYQ